VKNKTKEDFHLFTIFEKMEPDMQGYVLPTILSKRSTSGDAQKDEYKVYWMECDFNVTQSFIDNPQNGFTINDGRSSFSLKFLNKDFIEEPAKGDYFVLPLQYEESDLFYELLPKRTGPTYVKTYIDKDRTIEKTVVEQEYLKRQIDEASQDLFGFNLTEWPEHLGNVYVVWHHEEIRDMHFRGNDNPNGVFIQIETRQGHHSGGEIVVWEAHDRGSVVANNRYVVKPDDREVFVKTNDYPMLFRIDYYDSDGELVTFNKSYTFLSAIEATVSLAEQEVVIVGDDEDGNEKRSEAVAKYGKGETTVIGKYTKNLHSYFANHKIDHAKEKMEQTREFIFFDGEKGTEAQQENLRKAKLAVRDVLNKARKEIYVCDPYFKATDFEEYLHYINSISVKIHILNSKADVGIKGLKKLIPIIRNYNQGVGIEDYITCRVLKGNESMLHDRFIIVDNQVWNMGSSFGEFGARVCTLSRLSEAAARIVKGYIVEWWNGDLTRDLYDYETENEDELKEEKEEPDPCWLCKMMNKLYMKICG
jgi:hypothetical protein